MNWPKARNTASESKARRLIGKISFIAKRKKRIEKTQCSSTDQHLPVPEKAQY